MNTDWEFVCLDRLDTSGTLYRLHDVLHGERGSSYPDRIKRVSFVYHDLKSEINNKIYILIRNNWEELSIVSLPFIQNRYKRGG